MNKKFTEFWIKLIFITPFLLYSAARHTYSKLFFELNMLNDVSAETINHTKFFIETSFNIFLIILYLYLAALYYLIRKESKSSSN